MCSQLISSTLPLCNSLSTVYPKKYAHGFVVLCFVVVMQSFIMNSHEVFIHIYQGCFAGTGAIVRLPQCQWSKPDGYGKISQCITTTKHSKAVTMCIFLGIYCFIVTVRTHGLNPYRRLWPSHQCCFLNAFWPSNSDGQIPRGLFATCLKTWAGREESLVIAQHYHEDSSMCQLRVRGFNTMYAVIYVCKYISFKLMQQHCTKE